MSKRHPIGVDAQEEEDRKHGFQKSPAQAEIDREFRRAISLWSRFGGKIFHWDKSVRKTPLSKFMREHWLNWRQSKAKKGVG